MAAPRWFRAGSGVVRQRGASCALGGPASTAVGRSQNGATVTNRPAAFGVDEIHAVKGCRGAGAAGDPVPTIAGGGKNRPVYTDRPAMPGVDEVHAVKGSRGSGTLNNPATTAVGGG